MSTESLAFALAAGGLAAVNPCGFALLPAYLSLFVLGPDDRSAGRAVRRALVATGSMTLGFVTVFALFGLALTPVAGAVQRWLPIATVVIGLALVLLGLFLLAGRTLVLHVPFLRLTEDPSASARTMGLYGVSYAVASLGCTIGPFLAVTATTFRTGNLIDGVAAYVAYALGMGAVVGALAIGAALARGAVADRFRRLIPLFTRVSGMLLVVAGLYVAWYGWYELRVYAGGSTRDPIIEAASAFQTQAASWVEAAGVGSFAIALAGALFGVWLVARRRGRQVNQPVPDV